MHLWSLCSGHQKMLRKSSSFPYRTSAWKRRICQAARAEQEIPLQTRKGLAFKHIHTVVESSQSIFNNFWLFPLSMQKFKRRSSVVTKTELDKYWKHLNLNYVTEESDDSTNPNGIVEHKLPWRSKSKSSTTILRCDVYLPYF